MSFRICFPLTQGNVGVIRAYVDPSRAVTTFAFTAHPKLGKRCLQKMHHWLDVTHADVRMFKPECHRIPPKAVSCSTALFGLAGCFIGIAAQGGAGLGGKFRATAFDEITGFGDDVLQDLQNLAHAGFPVDEFRK